MSSLTVAEVVGLAVFVAGLLGLGLNRILPESFTTGPASSMIGAVAGMLTLLCALVLGLLIWTAYGVYAGQNASVQALAGKVLQLDLALADYGEGAAPVREKLKEAVVRTVTELGDSKMNNTNFVAQNMRAALRNLGGRNKAVAALQPQTDAQKQALASVAANVDAIAQTRLQMALALANPISYPLLFTVAGWASLIFLGYSVTSKLHTMTVVALALGACAVGSAAFLIVDLSAPYSGVFHVSPAPLQDVLSIMGKDGPQG